MLELKQGFLPPAKRKFSSAGIIALATHDHPVPDPVWDLQAAAIKTSGSTATLLEWDDKIPGFDDVQAEALKANRFLHKHTHA